MVIVRAPDKRGRAGFPRNVMRLARHESVAGVRRAVADSLSTR